MNNLLKLKLKLEWEQNVYNAMTLYSKKESLHMELKRKKIKKLKEQYNNALDNQGYEMSTM